MSAQHRAAQALAQAVLAGTAVASAAARYQNACGPLRNAAEHAAAVELMAAIERWSTVCEIAERVFSAYPAPAGGTAAALPQPTPPRPEPRHGA